MRLQTDHLAALLAIVETGTFESAARQLHITASAVSQRIRALENEIGQVVLVRATPCRATLAGESLVRLARQQRLLEDEAARELAPAEGAVVELSVAVNADSMATWFGGVLREAATWDGVVLRLRVEDQDHSSALLRAGQVLAAVTSDPAPVQGCSTEPLATLRYVPAASQLLVERHSRGRGVDWSTMPVVRFNAKDDLQQRVLDRHGVTTAPPTHEVPDGAGFVTAVRSGLGWGVLLESQLEPAVAAGDVVRLGRRDHVDVPLFWQRWRLGSAHLERLSDAVRREAARGGIRPDRTVRGRKPGSHRP
jgi:LysR family transcriptional regulator (chromosome initiation inhibitor)